MFLPKKLRLSNTGISDKKNVDVSSESGATGQVPLNPSQ